MQGCEAVQEYDVKPLQRGHYTISLHDAVLDNVKSYSKYCHAECDSRNRQQDLHCGLSAAQPALPGVEVRFGPIVI